MKELNIYSVILLLIGVGILGVTWLPHILKRRAFSYPIIFLVFGFAAYALIPGLPVPAIKQNNEIVLRLTELCVIISLMGSGLKTDPALKLDKWKMTFRLLYLTMLISIVLMALAGVYLLSLPLASALLIGAALVPTDPVLATDVQVKSPNEDKTDKVRFTLTAEAGLNDGFAFPFTNLAISVLLSAGRDNWFTDWLLFDFIYKIGVGVIAGYYIGRFLGFVIFKLPQRAHLPEVYEGFIALAITLITYGTVEMLHGYGFVAVFFSAYSFRKYERQHNAHEKLYEFNDQIERLFTFILILLLGGAVTDGLLDALTWGGALIGILLIFVIRPLTGMASLINTTSTLKERWVISFFGIRGIGSFFYIAYAFKEADFPMKDEIWSVTGFTVILSVVVHGIAVTPVMRSLDMKRFKNIRLRRRNKNKEKQQSV